jgi:hypothetical protein
MVIANELPRWVFTVPTVEAKASVSPHTTYLHPLPSPSLRDATVACSFFPQGEHVGSVHQPVQNGFADCWVWEQLVPVFRSPVERSDEEPVRSRSSTN